MPLAIQESEVTLTRLNRLINDLLRGTLNRNCFRPWEVELLLDLENSNLRPAARRDLLRRYQKAVQKHFDKTEAPPPRLSEYMDARRTRQGRGVQEPAPVA